MNFTLEDLSDPAPEPGPMDWNADGVLVMPDLMPNHLLNSYVERWTADNGYFGTQDDGQIIARNPGGYRETEYMRNAQMLDLCLYGPLADALEGLLGEPAGLHLNLSGWVSTERDWHQDHYLNPKHVGDFYAAVWIALGDVLPDSGPFQYVPGSHRWHTLTRDKIGKIVNLDDPMWPKHTEDVLTPLVEAEIEKRDAEVVTYLPKRGDVLIWHSRLYHRGSRAQRPGIHRPALIAHFSGINHRRDMPPAKRLRDEGWFFPL